VSACLLIAPFGGIGAQSDFQMRASIMSLGILAVAFADFTARAVEALDAGTARTREGSGVTWLPLDVDEQGWKELRDVFGNVDKRVRAVAEKSASRMDTPKDGFPVIVAVAIFDVTNGEESDPA